MLRMCHLLLLPLACEADETAWTATELEDSTTRDGDPTAIGVGSTVALRRTAPSPHNPSAPDVSFTLDARTVGD